QPALDQRPVGDARIDQRLGLICLGLAVQLLAGARLLPRRPDRPQIGEQAVDQRFGSPLDLRRQLGRLDRCSRGRDLPLSGGQQLVDGLHGSHSPSQPVALSSKSAPASEPPARLPWLRRRLATHSYLNPRQPASWASASASSAQIPASTHSPSSVFTLPHTVRVTGAFIRWRQVSQSLSTCSETPWGLSASRSVRPNRRSERASERGAASTDGSLMVPLRFLDGSGGTWCRGGGHVVPGWAASGAGVGGTSCRGASGAGVGGTSCRGASGAGGHEVPG